MTAMTIPNVVIRFRRDLTIALQLAMVAAANILAFLPALRRRSTGVGADVLRADAAVADRRSVPLTFVPFRLYDGLWRYTSLYDLRGIAGAVATSSVLFYAVVKSPLGPPVYPRSVFVVRCAAAGVDAERDAAGPPHLRRAVGRPDGASASWSTARATPES